MRLKDKVAVITGGSRGIGRACVEYFTNQGDRVFFTYKSNHATIGNGNLIGEVLGNPNFPSKN